MQVLVFEPKFVGHFLGFALQASKAYARLGDQVTLAVPAQARDSTQASVKLANLPEGVRVEYVVDVPPGYEKQVNAPHEARALRECLAMRAWDRVSIPSADFLLSGLMRDRPTRQSLRRVGADLILHNLQQVYSRIGKKARLHSLWDQLAVSLAKGLELYTVDPFVSSGRTRWPAGLWSNPVHPLPHFHDRWPQAASREAARERLGLAGDAKILGSIGDLGGRKGTELLIESFAASRPAPRTTLALYGIMSRPAKETLARYSDLVKSGQIVTRDEFLTDEEFRLFLSAVDSIWAGFPFQIGIASTLLHAAEAKRPVIASDFGCVGWMTQTYGLGRVVPARLDAMTEAIRWFGDQSSWEIDEAGAERLLATHTTENFARELTRRWSRLRTSQHGVADAPAAPAEGEAT
ncbi:MAG: glycosyltransferase [Planctomycetales bacterium]|nr:glycosyltransferase [Planctomycetales bacterium]